MAYCEFELPVRNWDRVNLACTCSALFKGMSGCAPAETMIVLALRILAEPMVVHARRVIASVYACTRRVLAEPKVVCVRGKLNPRCDLGMYFCRVLRLCCFVRGPVVQWDVCLILCFHVVRARRVLAEPTVVCARCGLTKPKTHALSVLLPCDPGRCPWSVRSHRNQKL